MMRTGSVRTTPPTLLGPAGYIPTGRPLSFPTSRAVSRRCRRVGGPAGDRAGTPGRRPIAADDGGPVRPASLRCPHPSGRGRASSVEVDGRAGHPGGHVAGQEQGTPGRVLRKPEAPEGNPVRRPVGLARREPLRDVDAPAGRG